MPNERFTGVLAVLHATTLDRRRLDDPDPELSRPLPIPLMTADGQLAGRIDRVWRDGDLIRYSGKLLSETAHAFVKEKVVVGNLDADGITADGMKLIYQGRVLSESDDEDELPPDVDVHDIETVMSGWLIAGATLGPSDRKAWPEVSLTLE